MNPHDVAPIIGRMSPRRLSPSRCAFVAVAIATPLCACSKAADTAPVDPAARPPSALPAAASASAAASAATSATPPPVANAPCKVEVAPFVIDKGARGETGVTLVRLPDDRFAVGYASGDGAPRVAIVSPEGTASVVDVDTTKLPLLGQRPVAKSQRYVHRVTPIAAKDLRMRVAVDVTEVRADGTRLVRCGPADEDALLSFEGQSPYAASDAGAGAGAARELRDCRSFVAHGNVWAVGFEADTAGEVEARWRVKPAGAKLEDDHAYVEHKVVPAEAGRVLPRAGQLDRYGYTALASAGLDDAGYVLAARYNGKLRISKRASDWAAVGNVTDYWFGTASGLPSIASRDKRVAVLVPIAGKLDLYGAAFPIEAEPPKPEKLTLGDPAGAEPLSPDAERTAVTTAITSHGQVVAAFLDGKPGKRRPRFALLSEALKPQGATFEPLATGDNDVADIKLVVLPDDRVLVSTVVARPGAGFVVEGAVLSCRSGLGEP